MSLDLLDLYEIREIGDRNNIRTRAQIIQDNFGIKPIELTDFRRQHGGYGIGKALLWAVGVGLAVGVVAYFLLPGIAVGASSIPFFAVMGIGAGATAAEFSLLHTNRKVMREYGSYLDDVAAQGRNMRDSGILRGQDIENAYDQERSTSHAEDLVRSRQPSLQADMSP